MRSLGNNFKRGVCMIGVAGPSGGGKTELARALAQELSACVLSLDHYYLDLSELTLAERAEHNFDHPNSLDWPLIEAHLQMLKGGDSVDRPVYDFTTHSRKPYAIRTKAPAYLLVDGILALHSRKVRELFNVMAFVDLPDHVCLARRVERDIRERGRSRESVLKQYREFVRPMFERYVEPTRQYANIVVQGDAPLVQSVGRVVELVRQSRFAGAAMA